MAALCRRKLQKRERVQVPPPSTNQPRRDSSSRAHPRFQRGDTHRWCLVSELARATWHRAQRVEAPHQLRAKALPNFGRCGNPQQVAHPSKATPTASGLFYAHGKGSHANNHPSHTTKDLIPGRGAFPNQRPTHHIPLAHSPPGQPLRQRLCHPARPDRRHRSKGHTHRSTRPHDV